MYLCSTFHPHGTSENTCGLRNNTDKRDRSKLTTLPAITREVPSNTGPLRKPLRYVIVLFIVCAERGPSTKSMMTLGSKSTSSCAATLRSGGGCLAHVCRGTYREYTTILVHPGILFAIRVSCNLAQKEGRSESSLSYEFLATTDARGRARARPQGEMHNGQHTYISYELYVACAKTTETD